MLVLKSIGEGQSIVSETRENIQNVGGWTYTNIHTALDFTTVKLKDEAYEEYGGE